MSSPIKLSELKRLSTMVAVREAVKETIRSQLKDFRTIETHGGLFDVDSLKRYSTKTPSCIIAVGSIPNFEHQGGQRRADVMFNAVIITEGEKFKIKDAAALFFVEKIIELLDQQTWGLGARDQAADPTLVQCIGGTPKDIAADNAFARDTDKKGKAIWVVRWTQNITFAPPDFDSFDDFLLLHAEWSLADGSAASAPQATDDLDLPGPP